jgi:hypothetical protein
MKAQVVDSHAEHLPRMQSHHDDRNLEVGLFKARSTGELESGRTLSGRSAVHYEHVAWAQTLDQLRDCR